MQIKATIIALTAREAMTMLERQITTLIIMMITATNNDYTKNKTTRHPWEHNCYHGCFMRALT